MGRGEGEGDRDGLGRRTNELYSGESNATDWKAARPSFVGSRESLAELSSRFALAAGVGFGFGFGAGEGFARASRGRESMMQEVASCIASDLGRRWMKD